MRDYLEAKHVLAVSSCTAALHLSLVALGVGPGDEVITSSITWPATANVIVHCGATPVFADVRDDTLNIDPERVRALVNERTKAIVPVDLYGQPADLDPLVALGLPVVEDAAHAAESRYRGRKIGSISDVTCFSLYATKNIAAGEGGLIATNRDDLAEALDDLRVMRRGHGSLYDIAVPGYKANLSDVLASIALVQLDKVERPRRDPAPSRRDLRRGRRRARRDRAGRARPARHARATTSTSSAIDAGRAARRATTYQHALTDENIGTSIHFLPVHQLTAYRDRLAPHQPPLPGRRARREPRCSRCRSRRRTRTTTSATRSRRSAACTRASPDEALAPPLATLARHRGGRRLHPLEDRPPEDARHHRVDASIPWLARSRPS